MSACGWRVLLKRTTSGIDGEEEEEEKKDDKEEEREEEEEDDDDKEEEREKEGGVPTGKRVANISLSKAESAEMSANGCSVSFVL